MLKKRDAQRSRFNVAQAQAGHAEVGRGLHAVQALHLGLEEFGAQLFVPPNYYLIEKLG